MTGLKTKHIKKIIDVIMTVLLLCLMAYQVTGEAIHEWSGIVMTILVIIHMILNRRWYGALLKGKYNLYRGVTVALNVLLLLSFAMTAFCGMAMSSHAVPFLYGMAPLDFVRRAHLSMSHWTFVLMGAHLGMHIPAMTAGLKSNGRKKMMVSAVLTCLAGIGFWLFLRSGMVNYLFFRVPFAFLDYGKAGWLVFFDNLLMLWFWAFTGMQTALILRGMTSKKEDDQQRFLPAAAICAAIIIGVLLTFAFPTEQGAMTFGSTTRTKIEHHEIRGITWEAERQSDHVSAI